MATSKSSGSTEHTKKTFGKSERHVPQKSQKAKKWYSTEDEAQPKKVCSDYRGNDTASIELAATMEWNLTVLLSRHARRSAHTSRVHRSSQAPS